MYSPAAFRVDDLEQIQTQIDHSPLAILVTQDEQGLLASHLPLFLDRQAGDHGTLYGHFARANKHWQSLANGAEVLVIFPGASAYVSPGYYPSKAEDHKAVPTWNYIAVHAYGQAEVFDDPQRLRDVVSRLSQHHEQGRPQPWSVDEAPADYLDAMLRGIVGFALPIARLEGKWKLSQNQTPRNRKGVRDGLLASSAPTEQAVAQAMQSLG